MILTTRVDSRFIYVHSSNGNSILSHKKKALDAGINMASYEHLLFTDIGTQGLFPFVSKDNILQASIACAMIVVACSYFISKFREKGSN